MKRQFFFSILILATMACSTTTEQAGTDCFDVRTVTSLSSLGARYAHVESAQNEHFLLTVTPNCIGWEQAADMKISRQFDQVCSDTGDFIAYQDGNLPVRCRIQKVEKVEDLAEARRLVADRTAPSSGE